MPKKGGACRSATRRAAVRDNSGHFVADGASRACRFNVSSWFRLCTPATGATLRFMAVLTESIATNTFRSDRSFPSQDGYREALDASFARVASSGEKAVAYFYGRLFAATPRLRGLFPAAMDYQRDRLLCALLQITQRLSNRAALSEYLVQLGRDHRPPGVPPAVPGGAACEHPNPTLAPGVAPLLSGVRAAGQRVARVPHPRRPRRLGQHVPGAVHKAGGLADPRPRGRHNDCGFGVQATIAVRGGWHRARADEGHSRGCHPGGRPWQPP